ncbi:Uncharacterised protein [Enterobacter cloacae]|nr:Uncharacterised protein [Enterobacter cloacae]
MGIKPPKPARIGKNSTPAPMAVPNRPSVQVVSDLRQEDVFVWPTIMLSVLLISHPLCVNEAGNLGNTGEIDIAAGNNADGFTALDIVVQLAA